MYGMCACACACVPVCVYACACQQIPTFVCLPIPACSTVPVLPLQEGEEKGSERDTGTPSGSMKHLLGIKWMHRWVGGLSVGHLRR